MLAEDNSKAKGVISLSVTLTGPHLPGMENSEEWEEVDEGKDALTPTE